MTNKQRSLLFQRVLLSVTFEVRDTMQNCGGKYEMSRSTVEIDNVRIVCETSNIYIKKLLVMCRKMQKFSEAS